MFTVGLRHALASPVAKGGASASSLASDIMPARSCPSWIRRQRQNNLRWFSLTAEPRPTHRARCLQCYSAQKNTRESTRCGRRLLRPRAADTPPNCESDTFSFCGAPGRGRAVPGVPSWAVGDLLRTCAFTGTWLTRCCARGKRGAGAATHATPRPSNTTGGAEVGVPLFKRPGEPARALAPASFGYRAWQPQVSSATPRTSPDTATTPHRETRRADAEQPAKSSLNPWAATHAALGFGGAPRHTPFP